MGVEKYGTFSEVRERLDEILVEVRKKELSLEKSLDLYEEAVRLGNRCAELVDKSDFSAEEAEAAMKLIEGENLETDDNNSDEQGEQSADNDGEHHTDSNNADNDGEHHTDSDAAKEADTEKSADSKDDEQATEAAEEAPATDTDSEQSAEAADSKNPAEATDPASDQPAENPEPAEKPEEKGTN